MSALELLMAGLLLAACLCLWRAWSGPTVADRTVSVDLLVRSLLALGASLQDVGRVIARAA